MPDRLCRIGMVGICVSLLAIVSYLSLAPFTAAANPATEPAPLYPQEASIQGPNPLIQNLVDSVSQSEISTAIRTLQDDADLPGWDTKGSRYTHSPELANKRNYIHARMQALGLDVRYHDFDYSGLQRNIEGTLSGWGLESDTIYIVSAHYDSTSGDNPAQVAPGADDNASGTAAVLEAARVLSQYRFKHTLRFVTFAVEEQGLIGSRYYAAKARSNKTPIQGVINLDMIAWDANGDRAMEVHAGTRADSQALGAAFVAANTAYGLALVPETITSGATTRSDHGSFWNQDYPAILVIEDFQDFNPDYHSTRDTLDRLNLPYATQFVQATVATLAELGELIPPGVNVQHAGPPSAPPGALATLSVQYANPGPNRASGVVLTDTLSPGLAFVGDTSGLPTARPAGDTIVWQVGDLAPYARSAFVVTASVASTLPVGALLTSTLEISGLAPGDDPLDNQATWSGRVPFIHYLPSVFKDAANPATD